MATWKNQLKYQLADAYRTLVNETWTNSLTPWTSKLINKKIWKSYKKLIGNHKTKIPYLRDYYNNKLHLPDEIEQHFRHHWTTKIFTEDDDPDNNFNQNHITQIENYMTTKTQETQPFNFGDLERLDYNCPQSQWTN